MNFYDSSSEALGYTKCLVGARIELDENQEILVRLGDDKAIKLTKIIAQHIVLLWEIPVLFSLPHVIAKRFLELHEIGFQKDYFCKYSVAPNVKWKNTYPTIASLAGIDTEAIKQDLINRLGIEDSENVFHAMYKSAYPYKRLQSILELPGETNKMHKANYIAVGFTDKRTLNGLGKNILFATQFEYSINELKMFKAQGKKLVFGSKALRADFSELGESLASADNFPYQNYKNAEDEIDKYLAVGLGLFPALYYTDKNLLKGFDTGSEVLNDIIRSHADMDYNEDPLSPEQKEYFYQEVMKNDPEIIQEYSEFAVRLLEAVSK